MQQNFYESPKESGRELKNSILSQIVECFVRITFQRMHLGAYFCDSMHDFESCGEKSPHDFIFGYLFFSAIGFIWIVYCWVKASWVCIFSTLNPHRKMIETGTDVTRFGNNLTVSLVDLHVVFQWTMKNVKGILVFGVNSSVVPTSVKWLPFSHSLSLYFVLSSRWT